MNLENPEQTSIPETEPQAIEAPSAEPIKASDEEEQIDPRELIETTNIAKKLDKELLLKIGQDCRKGFLYDLESRSQWMEDLKDWLKLASLEREEKSFPWENASNIKYPLITTAAMQFSARAYPSLIPSDGAVVKGVVIGTDPDGQKAARANRVSKYMSWQCMHQMDNWEEDIDKKLMRVAITGNMFKKTYYDASKGYNVSKIITVNNLVVHNWIKSLEDAERISEVFYLFPRQVQNKKTAGLYLDVDLGSPSIAGELEVDEYDGSGDVSMLPYTFVEQHTYLDLNKDGHQEPYIVTFELTSGKILRITARYDTEGIVENDKGKIVEIRPLQYYTKFGFIPNPDGSYLDIGFGHLLGPLNESINTGVNQITDAGTLSNMQSGFLGKGLRVKGGDYRMQPGEWKWVNATGDDLRKQIIPLPVKDPSNVLFELVKFLLQAGKELASIAEIFVGKMPGQNTPATTTQASIEQGMKVFTAIYKRVYRSLNSEFKKLYELNSVYLDENHYKSIVDDPKASKADWTLKGYDICPAADPTSTSQQEKVAKAQANLQLLPLGIMDAVEVVKRILEAQEQPNWEKLIKGLAETGQAAPPPPDPKAQEMQMKMESEKQSAQIKMQVLQQKAETDNRSKEAQLHMKAQENAMNLQMKQATSRQDAMSREHNQKIFLAEALSKAAAGQVETSQKTAQKEQLHQQKMKHNEESSKSKSASQKTTGKTGKTTQ